MRKLEINIASKINEKIDSYDYRHHNEARHRMMLETRKHSPSIEKYIRITTAEIGNIAGKVADNMKDIILENRTHSTEIYQSIHNLYRKIEIKPVAQTKLSSLQTSKL